MKTKKVKNVNGAINGTLIQQFGIDGYKLKAKEKYMSKRQLNHFTKILNAWKGQLESEAGKTVDHMQKESNNLADPNDRASQESEFGLELRTRDRERKLLRKIQTSLNKIKSGNYGYCDETGEEIGLKRLEARPVASLTLEAQERREISDKQYSDIR
jgi:DnaK suppressor protein